MLEQDKLIVGTWSRPESTAADFEQGDVIRQRPVTAPTGMALGLVREITPRSLPLARWFSRSIWSIVENPDDSLLMTVHHPWGWVKPWEVFSAEDHLISVIDAGDIFDVSGLRSARVMADALNRWTIRNSEGDVIGVFRRLEGGEVEIDFDSAIRGLPFVKMTVLAAALIETERPKD